MQTLLSAEERGEIAFAIGRKSGTTAQAEDIDMACTIISQLQQLRPGKTAPLPYAVDGHHATYFVIKVRDLRTFTSDDVDRLRRLTDRIIDVAVHPTAPGHIAVAVQRHGPQYQGLSGGAFGPYEPPTQRKRRRVEIDWDAGRVTDADDRRRLADLIDDVYNYQARMPDVTFFFDHVAAAAAAAAAAGKSADESEETSEQASAVARDACGYALCFAGMPDMRFGAFVDWLRGRHGLMPLVYMTFPPPGTAASSAVPMFVIHMQRTAVSAAAATGTAVLRAPRHILSVPRARRRALV